MGTVATKGGQVMISARLDPVQTTDGRQSDAGFRKHCLLLTNLEMETFLLKNEGLEND